MPDPDKVKAASRFISEEEENRQAAGSTFDKRTRPADSTLADSENRLAGGFTFFNPFAEVDVSRQNLPHWRQGEVWYFVTYRLGDSLPAEKLRDLETERENWLQANPEPHTTEQTREYWDRFGGRIQELLDAGSGQCWLRRKEVRAMVVESLHFGYGKRYDLDAWAVMPNHVHALLRPRENEELSAILHTWKSYTANRINRLLGRSGKFWQKESYDHIVRNPGAFAKIREYIRENPTKAKLHVGEFDYGSCS